MNRGQYLLHFVGIDILLLSGLEPKGGECESRTHYYYHHYYIDNGVYVALLVHTIHALELRRRIRRRILPSTTQ